jgi:hypothetical protein
MIQWVGVAIALVGFLWNGIKDYQKGEIKLPSLPQKQELTKVIYPIQYCLMAYDPNVDKVFYKHENGLWYEFPPTQRKYQDQGQEAVAIVNGTSARPQRYYYGQSAQASANTQRY